MFPFTATFSGMGLRFRAFGFGLGVRLQGFEGRLGRRFGEQATDEGL